MHLRNSAFYFLLSTRLPEESQNNSKTIYDYIQLPNQLQPGKQYFWQKNKGDI